MSLCRYWIELPPRVRFPLIMTIFGGNRRESVLGIYSGMQLFARKSKVISHSTVFNYVCRSVARRDCSLWWIVRQLVMDEIGLSFVWIILEAWSRTVEILFQVCKRDGVTFKVNHYLLLPFQNSGRNQYQRISRIVHLIIL